VWADRAVLLRQLNRLGRRLAGQQAASLHLLWADFGAGKTHTLLYLKQEIEAGKFGSIMPVYCALPKGCKTFVDIYRAVVRSVPADAIVHAYQRASRLVGRESVDKTLSDLWPSLAQCVRAVAIGGEQQRHVALGWLHAEPSLPTRDLQGLSIVVGCDLPMKPCWHSVG